MGVRIDEARGHHAIPGVDDLARAVGDVPDLGDPSPRDADVGAPARGAGAVHHEPVLDQQVDGHGFCPRFMFALDSSCCSITR